MCEFVLYIYMRYITTAHKLTLTVMTVNAIPMARNMIPMTMKPMLT